MLGQAGERGSEADSCRISGEPILPAILTPRLRPREVEEPAAPPALILSTGAQWRAERRARSNQQTIRQSDTSLDSRLETRRTVRQGGRGGQKYKIKTNFPFQSDCAAAEFACVDAREKWRHSLMSPGHLQPIREQQTHGDQPITLPGVLPC